jgi:hypothetical protein
LGEDLISLVCLVLNAGAPVSSWKVETGMPMNVGVVGVFIAPTTKIWLLGGCSRMAHRTVRCATGHCPVRQPRQQTVGVRPLELCLVGPPGCPVVHRTGPVGLSGVPPARALLLCSRRRAFNALQSTVVREVVVAPLLHRTVRCAPDTVR